jgi:hypothetical protein
LLASPGSLIEPWRNCSCSSLSSAMDPWVVVVVGVVEEEETELDLEFHLSFVFCFPLFVNVELPDHGVFIYIAAVANSWGNERKRALERERENVMLLTASCSMEDSRTACNGEWSAHGGCVLFLAPRLVTLWSTGDIGRRRRWPPCLPEFDEFRDDAMVGLSLAHALEQGFTEECRLLPLTAFLQVAE